MRQANSVCCEPIDRARALCDFRSRRDASLREAGVLARGPVDLPVQGPTVTSIDTLPVLCSVQEALTKVLEPAWTSQVGVGQRARRLVRRLAIASGPGHPCVSASRMAPGVTDAQA